MKRSLMLFPLVAAFALGACDSPTDSEQMARLSVLLTDAPSEYVESAVVTIGRIEILPMDGEPVVVSTSGGTYDLLQLQDGVTAELGSAMIEAGTYAQLRMIVSEATLTLKDGYTFNDGSSSKVIPVPSGAQTGIKINLSPAEGDADAGVEIRPGETILVVDFDVSQNFVMQGSPDTPAGIQGFLFTPLLRAVVADVAGSISGTVAAPQGVVVENLTVTATREGAAAGEAPASTLVKADGTFTVQFLAPGTYNVRVSDAPSGHTSNTIQVIVGDGQDVAGTALVLSAS